MRRAKIVCTLGPASSSEERVGELIEAGMNMARLNMSHGTQSDHEKLFRTVRKAKCNLAILASPRKRSVNTRMNSPVGRRLFPKTPICCFTVAIWQQTPSLRR